MTHEDRQRLELAIRAFSLMTFEERTRVLDTFAKLKMPNTSERFFEAVHVVIDGAP